MKKLVLSLILCLFFLNLFADKKQDFIDKYAPVVRKSVEGTKLFASVCMAQLILESGWGRHSMGDAKNLFGMRAYNSWGGKVISLTTRDNIDGKTVVFPGTGRIYPSYSAAISSGVHYLSLFKCYDTYEQSIRDRNKLILDHPAYRGALLAESPKEQIQAIYNAGYATSPDYVYAVMSIIEKNKLTDLDKPMESPFYFIDSTKLIERGDNNPFVTSIILLAIPVTLHILLNKNRKK